jgi:hypothetical protein
MQENDVNYHCGAAFHHFRIVGLPSVKHNPHNSAGWSSRHPGQVFRKHKELLLQRDQRTRAFEEE